MKASIIRSISAVDWRVWVLIVRISLSVVWVISVGWRRRVLALVSMVIREPWVRRRFNLSLLECTKGCLAVRVSWTRM